MDEKVRQQILAIRDLGETNMFDTNAVQKIANKNGYHELVIFIEENKDSYVRFVLTGEEK